MIARPFLIILGISWILYSNYLKNEKEVFTKIDLLFIFLIIFFTVYS